MQSSPHHELRLPPLHEVFLRYGGNLQTYSTPFYPLEFRRVDNHEILSLLKNFPSERVRPFCRSHEFSARAALHLGDGTVVALRQFGGGVLNISNPRATFRPLNMSDASKSAPPLRVCFGNICAVHDSGSRFLDFATCHRNHFLLWRDLGMTVSRISAPKRENGTTSLESKSTMTALASRNWIVASFGRGSLNGLSIAVYDIAREERVQYLYDETNGRIDGMCFDQDSNSLFCAVTQGPSYSGRFTDRQVVRFDLRADDSRFSESGKCSLGQGYNFCSMCSLHNPFRVVVAEERGNVRVFDPRKLQEELYSLRPFGEGLSVFHLEICSVDALNCLVASKFVQGSVVSWSLDQKRCIHTTEMSEPEGVISMEQPGQFEGILDRGDAGLEEERFSFLLQQLLVREELRMVVLVGEVSILMLASFFCPC